MRTALVLLALVTGCSEITINPESAPPPGRVADLHDGDLRLSRGVVFAFSCYVQDPDYTGPCRDSRATAADPEVASVMPAYQVALHPAEDFESDSAQERSTIFVVVGRQAGRTSIEVDTPEGDVSIDVEVVD